MGVTIFAVRHGQTVWNHEGKLAGSTDVAMTELGQRQARALAAPLLAAGPFDSVWTSDLQRASNTAALAGFDAAADPRLRELDFGTLEGSVWRTLPPEEMIKLKDFDGFQAPGGESLEALETRVMDFVSALEEGRHLVFTHGGVIRLLLHKLGHHSFVENCTAVAIDWTRGLWLGRRGWEDEGTQFSWFDTTRE